MSGPEEDIIRLTATRDEKGRRIFKSVMTPSSRHCVQILQAKIPVAIPIVFLPGIMGSNLKSKQTGDKVWRPPNMSLHPLDILALVGALITWGFRNAKERQELLKGELLTVDDDGSIDTGDSGLNKKTAKARGWGTAMRSAYHPIMALLEQRLEHLIINRQVQPWWDQEGQRLPADYGEEQGGQPALDYAQLLKAGRFHFDLWCCGYNWLNSNRQSGLDVIEYIDKVVLPYYRNEQIPAEKVILLTHSMGGLVARAITQIHQYPRILGVIHGVQPATGAPAIYHHMRCGYEGLSRLVLGKNAGEVTAVVANAAGALELVPSPDYHDGQAWLLTRPHEHAKPSPIPPDSKDIYTDIYMSSAWYGLVPEQNTKYLDMSPDSINRDPEVDPRNDLYRHIMEVKKFHTEISYQYHPETYVYYGADHGDHMHSWQEIIWQGNATSITQYGVRPRDNGRGSYQSHLHPQGPVLNAPATGTAGGDGTVSVYSGAAPAKAGVKASFRHGPQATGPYARGPGYEHQDSYNDPRAQWVTLYSIIRLAQLADWHPQDKQP